MAFFLRTASLDQESLHFEEGTDLYIVRYSGFRDILLGKSIPARSHGIHPAGIALANAAVAESHAAYPPFYYLLLKAWLLLAGDSVAAARLLSALLGTASLPVLYLLGRELFGKRVALIAIALFALSFFHIYYSQESRMYSLLVLETLMAMLLFVSLLGRDSFPRLAGFTMAVAAGLYTHGMFVFVWLTLVALLGVFRLAGRRLRWGLLLSLLIAAALYAPWAARSLAGQYYSGGPVADVHFTPRLLFILYTDLLGLPPTTLMEGADLLPRTAYILISLLGIVILCASLRAHARNVSFLVPLLSATLPILAFRSGEVLLGQFLPYGMQMRHFIIILPAFLLLLAAGLASLKPHIAAPLLLVLLFPSLLSLSWDDTHLTRDDWRGVAAHLAAQAPPHGGVLVWPGYLFLPMSHYLPERWPSSGNGALSTRLILPTDSREVVSNRYLPPELLYVTAASHAELKDPDSIVSEYLFSTYGVRRHAAFAGGISLYHLEKLGTDGTGTVAVRAPGS